MSSHSMICLIIVGGLFTSAHGQDLQKPDANQKPSDAGGQINRNRDSEPSKQGRRKNRRRRGHDAQKIFKRFDKNQDQQLSADEMPPKLKDRLKMIDADGDGNVSLVEMRAAIKKRGGKKGPRSGEKGNGKAPLGDKRRALNSPEAAQQIFERLDQNDDGAISNDEAPQRMKNRFDKIDKNSNGQIEQDEWRSMIEKIKAGGGKKKSRFATDPESTKPVKPKRPPNK